MFAGLNRRQWRMILVVWLAPLIANAIGIWHAFGQDELLVQSLRTGEYYVLGDPRIPHNPWPAILWQTARTVSLGVSLWLAPVLLSARRFQRFDRRLTRGLSFLVALILGAVFADSSFSLSQVWWREFSYGRFMSGIQRSHFVYITSLFVLWPGTTLIMLRVFRLSKNHRQC